MKKKLILFIAIIFTIFATRPVEAAEFKGRVRYYPLDNAVTYVQQPTTADGSVFSRGIQVNYVLHTNNLNNTPYVVRDESGAVVASGNTVSGGLISVTGLAVGTYTVELTDTDNYSSVQIVGPIENGSYLYKVALDADESVNYQRSMSATITITSEDEVASAQWVLVAKATSVTSYTKIGSIPNGVAGNDVNGTPISYRTLYPGGDVATYTSNGSEFNYFRGPLIGTLYSQYSGEIFATPVLSEAEEAYGYEFIGWSIVGPNYDTIYTTEQIQNMTVRDNIQIEARFSYPIHTLTFATDAEKGELDNSVTKTYTVEGNTSTVGAITSGQLPVPVAKDGYEFIGWYLDNTTNIIDTDTINSTVIDTDVVYYAKYRKIDSVSSLTIISTKVDQNGGTVINFSDGTSITIPKGKDGVSGKDGVTPSITIGQNGNWFVDGSDSGIPASGSSVEGTTGVGNGSGTKSVLPHTGEMASIPVFGLIAIGVMSFVSYTIGRRTSHKGE